MLATTNMAEEDQLFFFLDGFQPQANKELVGHDIKDVSFTIVLAEKLLESEKEDHTHGKPPKVGKAKGGGDCCEQNDNQATSQLCRRQCRCHTLELSIMEETAPCMVPASRIELAATQTLLILQLRKGVGHSEMTYLAAICEVIMRALRRSFRLKLMQS